jgi:alpha-galactosidase
MKKIFLCIILFISTATAEIKPPTNSAAQITLFGQELVIQYDGKILLQATVQCEPENFYLRQVVEENNGAVTQVVTLTSKNGQPFIINAEIKASDQSFPCEADRRQRGTMLVRHVIGQSRSLLNRAVYDRRRDWVLSVDQTYAVRNLKIEPVSITNEIHNYAFTASASEVSFRFRPRYYQRHRGLKNYEPWTYQVWQQPVVGWCSWFAFMDKVTEKDIQQAADVVGAVFKPYGLEYLQIDDGYQQENSTPDKWLNPNAKFPHGLDSLAHYISARGLHPGIWTNVAFTNRAFAEKNPALFITDQQGTIQKGRWINYIMDGSNPQTQETLIKPVYRGFSDMGWRYFKLDALRHLRYEGYNSHSDYFKAKKTDRRQAFRNVVAAVRHEIGRDNFLLACWGVRPELIGLVDGCRIGDDGYGLQSLTQYNSFNNVVWRNDPDHIELNETEAYRSCMATSLTGSLFMLTDKPAVYRTAVIEPALCSMPVPFTVPGQIYDVDPSCSMALDRIETEMSGSGERAADANRTSPYDLFLLEITKPWENWLVLGRTGERTAAMNFADLGLASDSEYLVFEYWSKTFKGSFTDGFDFGPINDKYNCQLFCIRKRLNRPQLLATSRHITCGLVDIGRLAWDGQTLSGSSAMISGAQYTLYIFEPAEARFASFSCPNAVMAANVKNGSVREITLQTNATPNVNWQIEYKTD